MDKLHVLLVFGGNSSEHEVSKMSAHNVYAALDNTRYDIYLAYVDLSGKWWLVQNVDGYHQGRPQLLPVLGQGKFLTMPGEKVIKPDVILPVVHGGDGEDGKIAALGELLHIPVVGCDTIASVVCWDKLITKSVLAYNDIPVAPFLKSSLNEKVSYAQAVATLGEPLFVKPTRAGSSIGVSKVHNQTEYKKACQEAFKYSDIILLEKYCPGRELEVAVLGNPPEHEASGVGEILPGEEFYSYEDKYAAKSTAVVVPNAEVDEKLAQKIRDYAKKAYALTGCKGLSRVDFLLDEKGDVILNEINTFPGFTNISQYPKLWHEAGISYSKLVDRLIELALETRV